MESELFVNAGSLEERRFWLGKRRILEKDTARCVAIDGERRGYFGDPHAQIDRTTNDEVTGVVGFQRFTNLFSR